jgi:hypothetical protein
MPLLAARPTRSALFARSGLQMAYIFGWQAAAREPTVAQLASLLGNFYFGFETTVFCQCFFQNSYNNYR